MRAIIVVAAYISGEKSPEVALVQRDHVIQQISSATFDPSFCDSILPSVDAEDIAPHV